MQDKRIELVSVTRLQLDGIEQGIILTALEEVNPDRFALWEDETGRRVDEDYVSALIEKVEALEYNAWRTA